MYKTTALIILYFLPIVTFLIWNLRLRCLIKKLDEEIQYNDKFTNQRFEAERERVWSHYHEKQAQIKELDERFGGNFLALMRYLNVEAVHPTCNPIEFKKRTK